MDAARLEVGGDGGAFSRNVLSVRKPFGAVDVKNNARRSYGAVVQNGHGPNAPAVAWLEQT